MNHTTTNNNFEIYSCTGHRTHTHAHTKAHVLHDSLCTPKNDFHSICRFLPIFLLGNSIMHEIPSRPIINLRFFFLMFDCTIFNMAHRIKPKCQTNRTGNNKMFRFSGNRCDRSRMRTNGGNIQDEVNVVEWPNDMRNKQMKLWFFHFFFLVFNQILQFTAILRFLIEYVLKTTSDNLNINLRLRLFRQWSKCRYYGAFCSGYTCGYQCRWFDYVWRMRQRGGTWRWLVPLGFPTNRK